jgi:ATP-binding cassette, subfamily C, type I secretion system permease/ATPase
MRTPKLASSTVGGLIEQVVGQARRVFLLAGLFSLGVNLLMLTVPLYMLQIYDRVLMSRSVETLLLLSAIAIVALVTLGVLEAVRSLLTARLGSWMEQKLGGYVLAAGISAAVRRRETSVQGLRDLAQVRGFLTSQGLVPLMDAPWMPLYLAVIFLLHPVLGFISVAGALVLAVVAFMNERATRRPLLQAAAAEIKTTSEAGNAARNADVVEAMGMLPALIRCWQEHGAEAFDRHSQVASRNAVLAAISRFLRLFLQLAVLGGGAYLVVRHEMTPGSMIAASILMGRALAPIDMAISGWRPAVSAHGAYRRLRRGLEEAPLSRPMMAIPPPEGRLAVEALTFLYPGQSEALLRGINFALDPGDCLAVIGAAAAGKTTLGRVIIGNLPPRVGHVRLDGADMTRLSVADRGRYIGYLPQDVELFRGSVRENITRFQDATDEEVMAAAQQVGAHELILRLQQGYDTNIGDGGAALSGGQRQRIGLARAVFGRPSLLLLDEPDANLDQAGAAALRSCLATLRTQGVTVILITHRQSLLQCADKILILRDGQLEYFGSSAPVLQAPIPTQPVGHWPHYAEERRP